MKYFTQAYFILLASCSTLYAPSLDTTSGTNMNKSLIITTSWNLDPTFTQTAMGSIAFTEGLSVTGTGQVWLGLNFPIRKQLNLRNQYATGRIILKKDLHLAEGTIIYGPNDGGVAFESPEGERRTVHLDGDVTISGQAIADSASIIGLFNADLDGHGHTLTLGANASAGAFYLSARAGLHNVTIKNCWNRYNDGYGTLVYSGASEPYDQNGLTFENVNFIARRGMPMSFFMLGFYAPFNFIIRGNTTFGNFGDYAFFNIGPGGTSYLVIEENSSLIIKDSTLTSGLWWDLGGTPRSIRFWFKSDTSKLILDNATFANNNNILDTGLFFAQGLRDQTVTLTNGTLVVRGRSTLQATTDLLSADRTSTFSIGDGMNPNNDFHIVVEPGATLDLIAANTNSRIVINNVH